MDNGRDYVQAKRTVGFQVPTAVGTDEYRKSWIEAPGFY